MRSNQPTVTYSIRTGAASPNSAKVMTVGDWSPSVMLAGSSGNGWTALTQTFTAHNPSLMELLEALMAHRWQPFAHGSIQTLATS